jgi:hypothetical protein
MPRAASPAVFSTFFPFLNLTKEYRAKSDIVSGDGMSSFVSAYAIAITFDWFRGFFLIIRENPVAGPSICPKSLFTTRFSFPKISNE